MFEPADAHEESSETTTATADATDMARVAGGTTAFTHQTSITAGQRAAVLRAVAWVRVGAGRTHLSEAAFQRLVNTARLRGGVPPIPSGARCAAADAARGGTGSSSCSAARVLLGATTP